ncbi:MAG: PA2779 family protein [Sulfuricella sp.]|nr:PA2779 family protein [Sulfuricella sp.]
MNSRFMRITSRLLIASVLGLGLPLQSTHAGLVGTDKVAVSAQSQPERERIRTFLDREDVRNELQTQGVDVNTAKARVDALTDEEVQKVAGRLDKMPAGGEIIGILFTIFVILLVTDILGFTKVFPFTRSIK